MWTSHPNFARRAPYLPKVRLRYCRERAHQNLAPLRNMWQIKWFGKFGAKCWRKVSQHPGRALGELPELIGWGLTMNNGGDLSEETAWGAWRGVNAPRGAARWASLSLLLKCFEHITHLTRTRNAMLLAKLPVCFSFLAESFHLACELRRKRVAISSSDSIKYGVCRWQTLSTTLTK